MKSNELKLTTSQFAKLHHVNKRTLHYYDSIGLFSPKWKGANGYRYYDYAQSMEFAFIRMLKELNLRIDEIKEIVCKLDEQKFLQTVDRKQEEIAEEIKALERTQKILEKKQKQLLLSQEITDMELRFVSCQDEYLLTAPYRFANDDVAEVFRFVQNIWQPEQYRLGVGSYISLEKVQNAAFEVYDGLFSPTEKPKENDRVLLKPKGTYLCGYLCGSWERLPELYQKMFRLAKEHGLHFTGYAYEIGINDFAVSDIQDYVTQVSIQVQNPSTTDL